MFGEFEEIVGTGERRFERQQRAALLQLYALGEERDGGELGRVVKRTEGHRAVEIGLVKVEGDAGVGARRLAEHPRERVEIGLVELREALAILLEHEPAVGAVREAGKHGGNFGRTGRGRESGRSREQEGGGEAGGGHGQGGRKEREGDRIRRRAVLETASKTGRQITVTSRQPLRILRATRGRDYAVKNA